MEKTKERPIQLVKKLSELVLHKGLLKPIETTRGGKKRKGLFKFDERVMIMAGTELARGIMDGGPPRHLMVVINKDFMNPRWVPMPPDTNCFVEGLRSNMVDLGLVEGEKPKKSKSVKDDEKPKVKKDGSTTSKN